MGVLGNGASAAFFTFEAVDVLLDAGLAEGVLCGGHGQCAPFR